MKVLHVIPSISPLRGGPSFALRALCAGLSAEGIHVDVVTTDDDGQGRLPADSAPVLREDGFTIHYFPRQTGFYTFSWPLTRWLATHIMDYDLVHIHALFSYAAIPAALFARLHRIPYIVRPLGTLNRWGMENRRPFLKRLSFHLLESQILRGAAAIHYTSDQERTEARLHFAAVEVVVPLGVDLSEFDLLPSPLPFVTAYRQTEGRLLVLFLSRLTEKKGLDLLLPAFAMLHSDRPDAMLVIAGTGEHDYVTSLRDVARELGIERDVVWAGFLQGEEKLSALAAASIFVLPSYSENFGVAPVEAMACGLPVIVSEQVAVAQQVAATDSGLVVQSRPDALAAALTALATDEILRSRLGANARRVARQLYSRDAMVLNVTQMYEQVLRKR